MAHFSNYLENKIIDSTLRGITFTAPTKTYLALFTADPTDANITTNEIQTSAFPAYVRLDIAQGAEQGTAWTVPTTGVTSNTKILTYPANNGSDSVTVTHIGIYDAETAGNLLFHGALAVPKTLEPTDVLSLGIGALSITVD